MPRLAAALPLLLCCCSPLAAGLGLSLRQQPGESGARHIRYVYNRNKRAGISDRIALFSVLAGLGEIHNATVHIRDLAAGPQGYLSGKHSPKISDRWERYFDTNANHGNPWHALVDLEGCVELAKDASFSDIFAGGATCVDVTGDIYRYTHWRTFWKGSRAKAQPSQEVVEATDGVARDHRLSEAEFGSVHIRRCDKLAETENGRCTSPESVARTLDQFPDIRTWTVFAYAEPGYVERLRGALDRPGRALLFEDDMRLNPAGDGDNYFAFMVAREINRRAKVRVNTHRCHGSISPDVEEVRGRAADEVGRDGDGDDDIALADVEAAAVCGGAAEEQH